MLDPTQSYLNMLQEVDNSSNFDECMNVFLKYSADERKKKIQSILRQLENFIQKSKKNSEVISNSLFALIRSGRKHSYEVIDVKEEINFMCADLVVKYSDGSLCNVRMFEENGWKVGSEQNTIKPEFEKNSIINYPAKRKEIEILTVEKSYCGMKNELKSALKLHDFIRILQKYASRDMNYKVMRTVQYLETTTWNLLELTNSYPKKDVLQQNLERIAFVILRNSPPFSPETLEFTITSRKGHESNGSVEICYALFYTSSGKYGFAKFVLEDGSWRLDSEYIENEEDLYNLGMDEASGKDMKNKVLSQYKKIKEKFANVKTLEEFFSYLTEYVCHSKLKDLELMKNAIEKQKKADPGMYKEIERKVLLELTKAYNEYVFEHDTVDVQIDGIRAKLILSKKGINKILIASMVYEDGTWKLEDENFKTTNSENTTNSGNNQNHEIKTYDTITKEDAPPYSEVPELKIDQEHLKNEIMRLQTEYQENVQRIVEKMQKEAQEGKDITHYQAELQRLGEELSRKCQDLSNQYVKSANKKC